MFTNISTEFDHLQDALEEAEWIANNTSKRQAIIGSGEKFSVIGAGAAKRSKVKPLEIVRPARSKTRWFKYTYNADNPISRRPIVAID